MKATDARRHSPEKLSVLRERGFELRRCGYRVVEIAAVLGVVRGTVYKWFRNAKATSEQEATSGGLRDVQKGAAVSSPRPKNSKFIR